MNTENQNQKPNIVEIAMKKREMHILEKLQKGSLSRSEIRELAQSQGKALPQNYVTTQEAIAKAFKVTPKTVQRWIRAGAPGQSNSGYDLIAIAKWKYAGDGRETDNNSLDPRVGLFIYKVLYAAESNIARDFEQVICDMQNVLAGLIKDKKTFSLMELLQYLNLKKDLCQKEVKKHYQNMYKIIDANITEEDVAAMEDDLGKKVYPESQTLTKPAVSKTAAERRVRQ